MQKKILLLIPVLISTLFVSSCGHTHEYEETVVNPTCEDDGYTLYTCKECGDSYQDEKVPALGHSYEILISEDLNLENNIGEEIRRCKNCDRTSSVSVSEVNRVDKGVSSFSLGGDGYNIVTAPDGYDEECFTLAITNLDSSFNGNLFYTFNADYGLFYREAFKTSFSDDGSAATYAYENGNYTINVNYVTMYSYYENESTAYFYFYYEDYGLTYEEALGNFAFYLYIEDTADVYEYELLNPYVLEGYSETWIKVNKNNRFYYTTKYQTHVCEDWVRPDITKADINWTHICRAETPEEAIVSTLIAQDKGATNVDVNLVTLKPAYRNLEDMSKIYKSFKDIGTISVYYNGSVSQQERLDLLKLSVEAGAGGIDLQGFMFHTGSTLTTQTAENVKYWEDKGYDMSFIDARPVETVIDPSEDAKQVEYINQIHNLGGKVLQSAHVGVEFTKEQALAYGEFINRRGVDIIKIVSTASTIEGMEETVLANRDAYYSDKITGKYSIHCTGSAKTDISRIIGPLFYHTYMAFHYNYLCKLQMMMDFLNNEDIDFDDSIPVSEAIERLKGKTRDPEYNYLVSEYSKLEHRVEKDEVAYALGKASDMSDRWTFNNEDTSLKLRSAEGTNSFSIRGAAYKKSYLSNNFEIETSLSGFFKPYSSSTRVPKFGLFIGDQDHMLALTYNFRTSNGIGNNYSIGLYTNSYKFAYDDKVKDALDTSLMDEISVNSNVANGDKLRLKLKYDNGSLSLYYSTTEEGNMILIKTYAYDEIKSYFTHDESKKVYFGNVVEVYLGSSSVGVENIINYDNTIVKN